MSRGTMSKTCAHNVLVDLSVSQNMSVASEEDLELVIDVINQKIRKFDQRIDIVTSMYDGNEFVVMVNTTPSAIMKLQGTYTPHEIEYFRLLVKEISLAEDNTIRMIQVLNLMNQNQNTNFSMSKSEKILNDWIEEGYFYSDKGCIYLGVRLVAEFGEFLRDKFQMNTCDLCKEVLLKGVDCEAGCDGHFHNSCILKYVAKSSKCPKCKETWRDAKKLKT
ncbi:Non-structural maintenance of chromosomes element 1 like [Pseudolycoriella hygida]|uniref:Non-structural maintenance of chromosomes element 1 homolog n=1 Tax=Pseudolycoriella hygida TaxID=35572 RepID=A0A9Q0S2I6_9DIPT|nr:Non-structural maintenance of chromosomes element 1 like [Pseudolycoriella hygida]